MSMMRVSHLGRKCRQICFQKTLRINLLELFWLQYCLDSECVVPRSYTDSDTKIFDHKDLAIPGKL